MKRYEYIRDEIDMGDLSGLNRLSRVGGWRVVAVVTEYEADKPDNYVLLERELPEVATESEFLPGAVFDVSSAKRVIRAAIALARAGETCGFGDVPSANLQEVYDAVRELERGK